MTATNIASGVYGSTPPMQSTTDVLYHSAAQFGPTTAGYSGASRCTSGSALQLAPSLYSDQYSSRISQTQFESTSPLSASTTSGIRSLDYSDQYQQSQTQYYNQSPQQQGLGILVSGGMAREMSTSPMDDSRDDSQQEQVEQLSSSMKRSTSASGTLQTADDIHAVIGKDGKTLVYICPKCDPSKVVEFTTKSNLKRHLENKNIHNTPYERRRDQKRWQGHEKKQVSRDETTLRMRKWRNCNPEKNRFNDMRCRVYRNARKIYGEGYSEAKEDYIRSEIERRKQNMIIRNSRRAEWANQAANNSGDGVQELSTSPSDSPISASTSGSAGFQIPESAFMFSSPYTSSPSMMVNQHIPSYGSGEETSYAQDSSSRSDKSKPDESKFLQDLKENRLPPRRRSRSALHTSMGTGGSQGENDSMTSACMSHNSSNILSYATRNDSPFVSIASHASGLTADSFEYGSPSPQQKAIRRLKKQRSVTDNPDFFRQNHPYVASSALGGFSSVAASSSGSYQDGYVDSTQQLQMLEQKYSSGTMAHSLFLSKSGMDHQPQQIHESLESVVESMEINQAVNLATSTGTATTGSTAPSGGLYGDRDASAWLTPSVTYNTHGLAQEAQPEDGSRGFPFPVIRDRKELARAAGIRLDIPSQHPLAPQHWISGVSGTHSEATMDELVGGSATSLESASIAQAEYSPLANSPLSGALSSPTHGIATSNNIHGDDDEDNDNSDNVSQAIHNQYHGHSDSASGMIKQKGSHFEVFNVSMPLYGHSLSTSESGFFATDAASLNEANYLAKEQAVVRRHSTAMANLSTL
ncbi:hypothetical protein BGZ98_007889 [Dissophora globulifera]|nr:hypothetical protein BGZ98_007889 [Dissophora globulifera]